jgi:hypothetical protein
MRDTMRPGEALAPFEFEMPVERIFRMDGVRYALGRIRVTNQ